MRFLFSLILVLSFLNADENLPLHILPHDCETTTNSASHHGGKTKNMFALVGDGTSVLSEVKYILPNLEIKEVLVDENIFSLPRSMYDNYHAISVNATDQNKIYSATYYLYKHGKPSQISPTKITEFEKATFEIHPNPLPREHDRYYASKEYRFMLTFDNKAISTEVKITTLNGSELNFKSDEEGILRVILPDDFKDVKPNRGANAPSYFILSATHSDQNKSYFTTLTQEYHVNPTDYWQSITYGIFTALFGLFIGFFIYYRRVKNG